MQWDWSLTMQNYSLSLYRKSCAHWHFDKIFMSKLPHVKWCFPHFFACMIITTISNKWDSLRGSYSHGNNGTCHFPIFYSYLGQLLARRYNNQGCQTIRLITFKTLFPICHIPIFYSYLDQLITRQYKKSGLANYQPVQKS